MVGQFVMGPLSDRFGRRPVLLGGMAVYCIASLLAIAAPRSRPCCWRARCRASAPRPPA
jgi:MFS family permease